MPGRNSYEYLNVSFIKEFFLDNNSLIISLLEMFLTSTAEDFRKLKLRIEEKNHLEIKMHAHKLKSGYKYIGAYFIGEMFESIEKSALSKDDISVLQNKYEETLLKCQKLEDEIKRYIKLNKPLLSD